MTESRRVGLIGVGNMGGAMAERLCGLGWTVGVRDIEPAREAECVRAGAAAHATPAALAAAHAVVIVAVVDAAQCDAVLFGDDGLVLGASRDGACVVLCPTLGPSSTEAIAARLGERGIGCIDAPMSGGPARARDGSMSLMVACADALFERQRALLEGLSVKLFRIGERPGDGARTKLVNNLLAAAALVISSEGMAMGVKAGLDPKVLLDIINVSSGRNSATQDKFPRSVLPGTFDFGFATALSYKDVRLCLDEAEAMGVPMIMGAVVRQILALTQAKYGPDSDFTSIAKLSEEWAGVQIRG